MKLYYFVGSCALADHIVLEWTEAPYDAVKMTHDSVNASEFLALNPNGTVPVLVHGDFVLSQNVAILTYLADLYPDARLLGDGSLRGRAEVMRWLGLLNSDVHPAFKPVFAPGRFLPDPAAAGKIRDIARANVRKYLERIDARLAQREWLTDQRSVADAYLFVMARWAVRLGVVQDGFEHLEQFRARMYGDAGVRAALLAEEGATAYETAMQKGAAA